jgi:protoporphyrinogen oxidase
MAEGHYDCVILGAGPAGLTAAYELTKYGRRPLVVEQDSEYVGGIARTAHFNGYRFDIGGHRFFSKNQEIEALWHEMLPADQWLECRRLSRIYYKNRFFAYPLQPFDALLKLGPVTAARCIASYARAKVRPVPSPVNVEDWVSNQFGRRLFEIFFKTYTEKVWGMKTTEISADWAAQRIRGLSLWTALTSVVTSKRRGNGAIRTLIDSFRYPRLGPGQLWETVARTVADRGGEIRMGEQFTGLVRTQAGWTVTTCSQVGVTHEYSTANIVSSIPLRELVTHLQPAPDPDVLSAAERLKYRDFLTVALVIDRPGLFDDNWIYIHDPTVKVGRVQNFKAWSRDMVPDSTACCLGLEYFCFAGDDLWDASDEDLIALATRELSQLGLCPTSAVRAGSVVRQKKAYPVYDNEYSDNVRRIRRWLETNAPGVFCVGRNGMHKYNNQDHSMMTALIVARRILGISELDPWRVNGEAEYHEVVTESGNEGWRQVPAAVGAH